MTKVRKPCGKQDSMVLTNMGTKTEAVTIKFTKNIIVNEYQYIIYLNRIFSILLVAQQT